MRATVKGGEAGACGHAALRRLLYEITETESSKLHAQLIHAGVARYPNAVVRVMDTNANVSRTVFNCVMYAFDWVDCAEPNVVGTGPQQYRFLIDTVFMEKVISQQLIIETPAALANTTDLVVYFDGLQLRHVAKIMSESTCASKWGVGHLYEHGLWDVPETYGNQVKYFKVPDRAALEQFLLAQIPCIHLTATPQPPLLISQ